jgi:outer membrane protein OmpA-like peptidoglycan-associated protein
MTMALSFLPTGKAEINREEHWIPLSDLMTGLMMMFLLVAIVFMLKVESDAEKVKELKVVAERQADQMKRAALLYDEMREQLYRDLEREFRDDLPRWKAQLDSDLAIRFEEPEILFDTGKALLKPGFITILDDFFPRYVRILSAEKYSESIEEIRIEGHTSTIWNALTVGDTAYFKNMELSQSRTRSTLQYVLSLAPVAQYKSWLIAKMTANGLSSSRPRLNPDSTENREASQRVEFRVRTNAEARIADILRAAQR